MVSCSKAKLLISYESSGATAHFLFQSVWVAVDDELFSFLIYGVREVLAVVESPALNETELLQTR
jgi:hypothetical protein